MERNQGEKVLKSWKGEGWESRSKMINRSINHNCFPGESLTAEFLAKVKIT